MSTSTKPKRNTLKGKKDKINHSVNLPSSTTTIEIGGVSYFVTPTTDMQEWLGDVQNVLDSKKALEDPGESIPFDDVMKRLGIKLPPRTLPKQ